MIQNAANSTMNTTMFDTSKRQKAVQETQIVQEGDKGGDSENQESDEEDEDDFFNQSPEKNKETQQ